jgi:hypothetical protein
MQWMRGLIAQADSTILSIPGCEQPTANLDGNVTAEACIAGTINFTHATSAKWRKNFVGT